MTHTAAGNDRPAAAAPPWARQPSRPQERKTARTRRMVTTLPAWEPVPPGEILVNRTRER